MTSNALTRRGALAGATTVGLALPILSACGDTSTPSSTESTATDTATSDPTSTSTSGAPGGSTPAASGAVSTADVPVGGGVILADEQVVVTQPTEGEIKVFSSICTHTGCPVSEITDVITCPCHGSTFDLATGDVLGGPAASPLPAVDFTVSGDQVVLG